jgi:hypothetical protein
MLKFENIFYVKIKEKKMVFTWRESLSLGVIKYLKDPELVRYFVEIANKKRKKHVENESRDFHCSLRLTRREKMEELRKLMIKGHYSIVPITCSVPFTNSEWRIRIIKKLLNEILYFREGFLKKNIELESGICVLKEQLVSEKIMSINKYMKYYCYISNREFDEALFDFLLFNDYKDDYPYILLDYDFDGQPVVTIIG